MIKEANLVDILGISISFRGKMMEMKEFKVSLKKEKIFDRIKFFLGILAILVGLTGLVLPILPGWILIFVGLELLGIHIVFIERLKEYALKKINDQKKKGKK